MANYNDGRIRNSRIGIQSYTNNEVTLDVIGFTNIDGKVGIGTTPNVNSEKLHVAGSIRIDNQIYDSANRSGTTGGFLSKDANGIKWIDINPLELLGIAAYNNNVLIGAGQSFFGINFISGINTSGLSTDVIEGYVNDVNPSLLDIVVSDYWGVGVNSSIYRFSDVGIGTDSPIASLDVRGSVNIGTSIGSTSVLISGATGDVFIENLEVNSLIFGPDVELNPDRLTINEYLSVGLGSTALLTADTLLNKVGIGSTLPEQKLDVAGSVKIDGAIYDSNNSRGGVNEVLFSTGSGIGITWKSLTSGEVAGAIEISQSSPATPYYIVGSGDTTGIRSDFYSNSDIIFTGDGRLGIGTTQPTEEIEVIGDLKVSGITTTQNLYVVGVSTFRGNVNLGDADAVVFGDGGDLRIFSGGNNSFIQETSASGNLYIDSTNLVLRNGAGNETLASFLTDGAVELYHNSLKKFETSGIGVTVFGTLETQQLNVSGVSTFQGNVNLGDGDILYFGDGDDLAIYHNGSNSFISDAGTGNLALLGDNEVWVGNTAASEYKARFITNGAVELYYGMGDFPAEKKFETTGIGVSISNGTSTTATIAGPAELVLDPAAVGDNTGLVRIKGDLYVDGTQTIINSTTIELADFIVGIATTATTDLLADGAGIQIGPDNTFLYNYNGGTNPSLQSSENLSVATGKVYQIGTTERLSADTLSLGTGTTIHSPSSNVLTLGTSGVENVRISSGNVGINSTAPTEKLDVNGTTKTTQLIVSGVSTLTTTLIGGGTSTGTANQPLQVNGGVYVSGNVGINSTTPTEKLDVNGTTKTTQLIVSGITTFQNDVNIGVGGTTAFFDVSTGRIGIGTIIDIVPYDNLNGGTLSVEASAGQLFSITNNLTSGSIFSVNDVSGIPSIDVDADGTIQLAPYGTTEYVGIGTTNPTAKLDVNGTVKATEFIGIGSQISNITFRQLSDVDGSNLVPVGAGTTTPDYLVIYDPNTDSFRFVDPKTYFGINNDFDPNPAIVDYGTY